MIFQISAFCFLFLLFIIFHIAPSNFRKWILLLASIVFIRWQGGLWGLIVISAITLVAYTLGIVTEKLSIQQKEKAAEVLPIIGIIFFVFILFGWKYMATFAGAFSISIPDRIESIGIPIGLSFYSFQAISYMADIRMGKIKAQKNLGKLALYMMWFPKWMSGPIERTDGFIRQIDTCGQTRLLDEKRLKRALTYILWGLFMKLVLADRLGVVVDVVYSDIPTYGFLTLLLTSILYSIQIYCDFAGYTNTMIGVSSLFGIELTQNFRIPYMAENVVDFWRRWHISLSSFLKDYIYIPLGGNRKGSARKALNTVIVFLVCGAWHGAGMSFIVWGLLHGILNVLSGNLKKTKASILVSGFIGRIINFIIVTFAWIFFRASNLGDALTFIKGMIPFANGQVALAGFEIEESMLLGISTIEWIVSLIAILVLVLADSYADSRKELLPDIIAEKWSIPKRAAFVTLLTIIIFIFGKYGAGDEIRSFVYMQF